MWKASAPLKGGTGALRRTKGPPQRSDIETKGRGWQRTAEGVKLPPALEDEIAWLVEGKVRGEIGVLVNGIPVVNSNFANADASIVSGKALPRGAIDRS